MRQECQRSRFFWRINALLSWQLKKSLNFGVLFLRYAIFQFYCKKKQQKTMHCFRSSMRLEVVPVRHRTRFVNGPTNSGPNPARTRKYKPEPGPNPARTRKLIWSSNYARKNPIVKLCEKFCNVAKLFWLYFCEPKTKSTSQARIKPEIFVNFKPEPCPNPARTRTRPEKPGATYNSAPNWSLFRHRDKNRFF